MILTQLFDKISVDLLKKVKCKLIKIRQYFSALKRDDRKYLELCIRCKPKFKSPKLLMAIARILIKIIDYLKSFDMKMRDIGRPIVMRICTVAYSWGNKDALRWKDDPAFTFYWGLHSRDWGLDRMFSSRRRRR